MAYSFNGDGEYFLSKADPVVVQGRAERVTKNGTEQDATFFSSIVGLVTGAVPIEFRLNNQADGIGEGIYKYRETRQLRTVEGLRQAVLYFEVSFIGKLIDEGR